MLAEATYELQPSEAEIADEQLSLQNCLRPELRSMLSFPDITEEELVASAHPLSSAKFFFEGALSRRVALANKAELVGIPLSTLSILDVPPPAAMPEWNTQYEVTAQVFNMFF